MEKIRQALRQIDEWVGKIPLDFTLHFIISALLSGAGTLVAGIVCGDLMQSTLAGLMAALVIGVGKEIFIDAMLKGTYADVVDLCADLTGAAAGAALVVAGAIIF